MTSAAAWSAGATTSPTPDGSYLALNNASHTLEAVMVSDGNPNVVVVLRCCPRSTVDVGAAFDESSATGAAVERPTESRRTINAAVATPVHATTPTVAVIRRRLRRRARRRTSVMDGRLSIGPRTRATASCRRGSRSVIGYLLA